MFKEIEQKELMEKSLLLEKSSLPYEIARLEEKNNAISEVVSKYAYEEEKSVLFARDFILSKCNDVQKEFLNKFGYDEKEESLNKWKSILLKAEKEGVLFLRNNNVVGLFEAWITLISVIGASIFLLTQNFFIFILFMMLFTYTGLTLFIGVFGKLNLLNYRWHVKNWLDFNLKKEENQAIEKMRYFLKKDKFSSEYESLVKIFLDSRELDLNESRKMLIEVEKFMEKGVDVSSVLKDIKIDNRVRYYHWNKWLEKREQIKEEAKLLEKKEIIKKLGSFSGVD